MNTSTVIEMTGYLGSFLVLISFLMASVVKLRIVNTVGSMIFAVYALIIHSYPTALMNACLVLINLYYLWKLRKESNEYELVSLSSQDHFLDYMLERYREDIEKCFPHVKVDREEANRAYLVCCNGMPAGVMLGSLDNGTFDIMLDYSIPAYRDCSVGEYLIGRLPEQGICRLLYAGPDQNHKEYLSKMGFVKEEAVYKKNLV